MSDMRERVLAEAERWLGTPYRHQASLQGVGCDCLGLVRGIWCALYGNEPELVMPYSADWAESGKGDPLLDAARQNFDEISLIAMQPGDLILFRWKPQHAAKHAGILSAPDQFIHAYQGHSVMRSALVPQWRRRIAGAFSFKEG